MPLVISLANNNDQNQDKLYIDPKNRIFYHVYSIEKIYEDLFSGQAVSVENISREEVNMLANEPDFRPRATKDLMWHIAFTASNGKLINELSEHEIIHLGKWPYLGLESQKYMKIAEYFKSHAASLSTMIAELGIAPSIANDFYNASYLAGHIDTQETINTAPHRGPATEGLNIFDKIKNLF